MRSLTKGRPYEPVYDGAEEFTGMREAVDGSLIDPTLTRHVAERQSAIGAK